MTVTPLRDLSIKTKFFVSFAALLLLLLGVGGFAFTEFSSLARINRFYSIDVLPGLTVSGRLHDALNDIRIGEAEYLHARKPGVGR